MLVMISTGLGLLIKLEAFILVFVSSNFSGTTTFMRCCSKWTTLDWRECNATELQFINVEFNEHTRGSRIVAVLLNVQFCEIIVPLDGQFSVTVISPMKLNSKCSNS